MTEGPLTTQLCFSNIRGEREREGGFSQTILIRESLGGILTKKKKNLPAIISPPNTTTNVKNKSCHHQRPLFTLFNNDDDDEFELELASLAFCLLNCRMTIESLKDPNKSREEMFGI